MQWYYIRNAERIGPVDEDELRAMVADGRLGPDDLVWNETMGEDWAEIGAVPDLSVEKPPPATRAEAEQEQPAVVMPPPLSPSTTDDDEVYSGPISCTEPVSRAWKRMVAVLFTPFDIGKWFALGVSAWLASLGEAGRGASFNIPGSSGSQGNSSPTEVMEDAIESVREFMNEYGNIVIMIGVVVVLLFTVLGLLVMWLNCRGKFMFLDNVVHDRAEIGTAWHETVRHGNSLFRWNIVYGFICLLITLMLLAAAAFAVVLPCARIKGFAPGTIPAIIILAIVWILFALIAGAIGRLRDDFVAPIMYHMDLRSMAAWNHFLDLWRTQTGTFIVYLLFRFVLTLGVQFALGLITIATCCIAGCLLGIPYIGAVVALPVLVFFRAYSLEYLAQFGKEYRMFAWR